MTGVQTCALPILQIGPARLADLRHGRVARFSVERLILMLATIDRRVALSVVNVGEREIRWFRILRERRDERIRAAVVDVAAAGAAAKAGLKCGGGRREAYDGRAARVTWRGMAWHGVASWRSVASAFVAYGWGVGIRASCQIWQEHRSGTQGSRLQAGRQDSGAARRHDRGTAPGPCLERVEHLSDLEKCWSSQLASVHPETTGFGTLSS